MFFLVACYISRKFDAVQFSQHFFIVFTGWKARGTYNPTGSLRENATGVIFTNLVIIYASCTMSRLITVK
jgi:hypothetical protein